MKPHFTESEAAARLFYALKACQRLAGTFCIRGDLDAVKHFRRRLRELHRVGK